MNFTKYSVTVDFEGIALELPKGYKYIARDKYGYVTAWINRPTHGEYGAGDGSETPITFGHQKGADLPVVRKYRDRRDVPGVMYLMGAVTHFR